MNPAPIIETINAFDINKGTKINFNIIGGTNIVRSNKIYIYSVETNQMICSHLYISTKNEHVLPPSNDPSIQYESGFSSADFTNEKKYYAKIQTFTDTIGLQGASGLSISVLFWCLFAPTLTINTITPEINISSYNVTAIYNTQVMTEIPINNNIQTYKFDLYNDNGELIQSSGTIVSSGNPLVNPKEFQINYNFTNLSSDITYYTIVTCVSTQGMTISSVSDRFTVIIDMPTFTKAKVSNNECDGYITITSKMTNIEGKTNVDDPSILEGEIDLTQDGYVVWDDGFTFPTVQGYGQWTLQLWGRAFNINKRIIRLQDGGRIEIFLNENYDKTKIRADMYIYPYKKSNLCSYINSELIDKPTDLTKLNVWVRCKRGLYEIMLKVLA